jgi:hypothetical protein
MAERKSSLLEDFSLKASEKKQIIYALKIMHTSTCMYSMLKFSRLNSTHTVFVSLICFWKRKKNQQSNFLSLHIFFSFSLNCYLIIAGIFGIFRINNLSVLKLFFPVTIVHAAFICLGHVNVSVAAWSSSVCVVDRSAFCFISIKCFMKKNNGSLNSCLSLTVRKLDHHYH